MFSPYRARKEKMFRRFLFAVVVLGLVLPALPARAYDQVKAQSYLAAHSNNPWSTMGLFALGAASIPSDYLKTISGSTANDYAAPILAIAAIGQDPHTFGVVDYVAKLKSYYTAGQIGDATTLNDDIFGLLALDAAGESASPEAGGAQAYLIAHQNSNGGWGFATGGNSDSNMTAAAIVALRASGVAGADQAIVKALDYLKTAQNSDGGFTYDPASMYGTASDASSTAWVLWALTSSDVDQSTWVKDAHTPVQYLESTQAADGFFQYQAGSGEDAFSATTTAYAVIALAGKTLPLKVFSGTGQQGGSSTTQTFGFRIEGQISGICVGVAAGPTALDIVKNASTQCGFAYHIKDTSFGPYLDKIGSDEASGTTGWMYAINNKLPSVGAASYTLASGDTVLWHFGAFDWQPATGSTSNENSPTVQLSVNVTPSGQVQGESIGFVVTPSALNFGDVKVGTSASKTVTLKNIGTVNLAFSAKASGDAVFTDGLKLDDKAWSAFSKIVTSAQQSNVTASLAIPANSQLGQKIGQLVFWAEAK